MRIEAHAGDVISTRPPTPEERRYYDLPPSSMLVITRATGERPDEAFPGDRTAIAVVG
ncbi:hypothetical protein GCM10022221_45290 [Actinocorallia aurea]